ncbi:MAG: lysine--tRNA ligase [Candidatus Marsarchaeota archaeon]|nr:lysine--tRNA ligase [Candidatus Marsarchaeota archaeon]
MAEEVNTESLKEFISSLPYTYNRTNTAKDIKENYAKHENATVSVAGRALAVRKAGKIVFIDLLDWSGKIQAYFEFTTLGEKEFSMVKSMNPGDILGVEGTVFKTHAGEVSIKVKSFKQLSKAIRPLPDKWHGLQNVELRYRKRYLDLIMNPDVRRIFTIRSKVTSLARSFLEGEGFIEVETSVLQPIYGGANAQPFKTHVNTLNEEHYLRIADELYLKRLIIGGFEKVFEVGKDFRNEDVDSSHNPEFTQLEWYQAYADYEQMMSLTEHLVSYIVRGIFGTYEITHQGKKMNFRPPFKRLKFVDSLNKAIGKDTIKMSDKELLDVADKHGVKMETWERNRAHTFDKLFKALIQPNLVDPTFIIDYPAGFTTLCRPKRGDPSLIEKFELFAGGIKFANAYSELNNPIIQKENFESEVQKNKEGDKETEPMDMDFIEAMEYGMPPTGGVGLGMDRFIMILTDCSSMKEVILFPLEKREKA